MSEGEETRYLNAEERAWVAKEIDAELRRRAGRYGISNEDINAALATANVIVAELLVATDPVGFFQPPDDEAVFEPIIGINTARHVPEQVRVIAHELAHYLMYDWVAPALYGADTVVCPGHSEEGLRATRHDIAQAVDRRWCSWRT